MILDVGRLSGTIADTEIAFGTAADTIGGDSTMTVVGTPAALVVTNSGSAFGSAAIPNNDASFPFWDSATGLLVAETTSNPLFDYNVFLVNLTVDTDAGAVGAAIFDVDVQHDAHSNVIAQSNSIVNTSGTPVTMNGSMFGISNYQGSRGVINVGQQVYGYWNKVSLFGSTITGNVYQFYADTPVGTAAATIDFWGADFGARTNAYYFWGDSDGVFRIKHDNTFDSVYQAIPALYNPQFTKYTPGAANYERIVEYWTGNVATVGTEAGGTGTQRALNLIGSVVEVNGVPITTQATAFVPSLMLMGG